MALINIKKANIYQLNDNLVLKEVDFRVDEGEFIYIIGRVGSGKTSLLKTLYFELDIDEAEEAVVLDHQLIGLKRKHVPALRRQMGIIFQDFQLLSDRNVYENLIFVLKSTGWKKRSEMDKRIFDVLSDVGMTDKAKAYPHELSGGEQQRIAIARAILNKPKIIIADEPTGNLDPETAESIIALLRQISQTGTAVILTTHNIPLLDKYPGIVYRCADNSMQEVTNDFNQFMVEEELDDIETDNEEENDEESF
ncbi:MAG: cell division ATP-binding protein FtsE [Prevotella sp.]|nr:ATP-binding cassette domain-containing protein [Prevotella sp.]MCI5854503.1 ATP-binding cassette domain-containing protein [Prevotella sp.]MDD6738213.1 ATP-binding cassette domain-containing protein [Prevotella sp.]MDY6093243.1 ATP-binding cassette domain-containing protein [Prevotella sp.]